jgi:hypothetical protein
MSYPAKKNPALFIYLREEKIDCWKIFPISFFLRFFMFVQFMFCGFSSM